MMRLLNHPRFKRPLWTAGLLTCLAFQAGAAPPEISDPDGHVPDGLGPGAFPTTVTAANVAIQTIPGSTLNGTNSNNLKVSFPSAGPIRWTESRHNEGDVAMLISPGQPNDPSYYPPAAFFDDYKPINGGPFENTTLAWRVNREAGALFATVRHNGFDNQDSFDGSPVGITNGIAYFNSGFGQGFGYRMNDGVFANGGGPSADLQMGVAGNDGGAGEASFDVATAFFPYDEGWLGGWVAAPTDEIGVITSGSPQLPVDAVSWIAPTGDVAESSIGRVTLGGNATPQNGMLFVAASHSDNASNIAAGAPSGDGWDVVVREDNDTDTSGQSMAAIGERDYQFLYLPYATRNLVGGHVRGSDGAVQQAANGSRFTITRRGAGEYGVKVLGANGNQVLTENDGMLMLSVAGMTSGANPLPGRAFMSYDYDSATQTFIVQARELAATDDPRSVNQFGDYLALSDTNFYFAFIDFAQPPTLATGLPGDFNGDGALDAADIDALSQAVRQGGAPLSFDVDGNGAVNGADRAFWVETLRKTYFGDANMDGEFSSTDFVVAFQAGEYEDATPLNSTWADGDWDGDGEFDSSDFVEAFTRGGYELGPRAAVAAVPEPSSSLLIGLSAWGLWIAARRRTR